MGSAFAFSYNFFMQWSFLRLPNLADFNVHHRSLYATALCLNFDKSHLQIFLFKNSMFNVASRVWPLKYAYTLIF